MLGGAVTLGKHAAAMCRDEAKSTLSTSASASQVAPAASGAGESNDLQIKKVRIVLSFTSVSFFFVIKSQSDPSVAAS